MGGCRYTAPSSPSPPALSAAPSHVLPVRQELNTPPIPSGCSPLQPCLSFPIPLQHPRCTPESQGRFPKSGPPCWLLPPCSLPAWASLSLAACLCRQDLALPVPARPYPRAPLVGGCIQSRPWHHWSRGLVVPWGPRWPLVPAAEWDWPEQGFRWCGKAPTHLHPAWLPPSSGTKTTPTPGHGEPRCNSTGRPVPEERGVQPTPPPSTAAPVGANFSTRRMLRTIQPGGGCCSDYRCPAAPGPHRAGAAIEPISPASPSAAVPCPGNPCPPHCHGRPAPAGTRP